jgi:hypothetical protein
MHMRAVFCDDFGVGCPAHRGNDLPLLDAFANDNSGLYRAQVRVKRINFNALHDVRTTM